MFLFTIENPFEYQDNGLYRILVQITSILKTIFLK